MAGYSAGAIVAGGTESMSLVPMGGHKPSPNPTLVDSHPDVYLITGLVAENHAREHAISREEQDAFALGSHQRAVAAIDGGRFAGEIVTGPAVALATDEGLLRDTSIDALGKLVQAGLSREGHCDGGQFQPDERRCRGRAGDGRRPRPRAPARAHGPRRRVCDGLRRAGTFMYGPVPAIRKALKIAGLTFDEHLFLVELNEAFAAQVLACLRELPIDPDRLNVNGGAIALGHRSAGGVPSSPRRSSTKCSGGKHDTAWFQCASAAAWAQPGSSSACSGGAGPTGTGLGVRKSRLYCEVTSRLNLPPLAPATTGFSEPQVPSPESRHVRETRGSNDDDNGNPRRGLADRGD